MNIPQSEIDKLNNSTTNGLFDEHIQEEEQVEEKQIKQENKEEVSSSSEDVVADKARIPYSRFESVNEAKIRAEAKAEMLEQQLIQYQNSKVVETNKSDEIELPQEWVELYGDSEAAKKAYQVQIGFNERLLEQATEKAYEKLTNREREEKEAVNNNLEYIESNLLKFQEKLGRKLTEAEEDALLDIQDEFTQKDENGKYVSDLLSTDKAYEIYTLRNQTAKFAKSQARNKVVSITGASSEGDISTSSVDFKPNVWGSWRDKI